MDLLGSILGKMDAPPTAPVDEETKKKVKEAKEKEVKFKEQERKKKAQFREQIAARINKFLQGPSEEKKLVFEAMDKLHRSIAHDVAETAGLSSYSFGEEDVDRQLIVWKKEFAPSEEELEALKNGEEYDPVKTAKLAEEKRKAETAVTPRKVACRLCGTAKSNTHIHRIFSQIGKQKKLKDKIIHTCGIVVKENDYLPKVICRNCEHFVNKMWSYRLSCQQVQIELRQNISVEILHLSPPASEAIIPSKANEALILPKATEVTISLGLSEIKVLPKAAHFTVVKPIQQIKSNENTNESTSHGINKAENMSVFNDQYDGIVTSPLSADNEKKLRRAIDTRLPHAIAKTMPQEIQMVVKRDICDTIYNTVESLKRRDGTGSVLVEKFYKGPSELAIEDVWNEIQTIFPFLIDIFNSITGSLCDVEKTLEELKMKYVLIYSILMNARWHECTLIQRVNTALLVEGGCSKKLQRRLNKYGVCLSYRSKDYLRKKEEELLADKEASRKRRSKTDDAEQEKYFEKYAKIVGEDSGVSAAQITKSNKSYGMVPSKNKQDKRSIEETLKEIRERKKSKQQSSSSQEED